MAAEEKQTVEDGDGIIRVRSDRGVFDRLSVLKDILGYFLFSYNQIPLPIDELELVTAEKIDSDCGEEFVSNPRELRERKRKSREIAREMKNLKKLNESVKMILASLQSALEMLEHIPYVLFILGSSSKQPSAAFEVHFQGNFARCDHHERCFLKSESYTKSFSRKIIRELISHETAPFFTGMRKLFVFIKTEANSCVPEDFIPKRGYILPVKKMQPTIIQLTLSCECMHRENELPCGDNSRAREDISSANDIIWFQCKKTVRGIPCRAVR